jgi:phosphoribulokinase
MHVLIIPSWYPNTYNPLYGVYVKEQAEALAKYDVKIGVISIEEINVLQIVKERKIDFFSKNFVENNVVTYCSQYPVPPKLHTIRKKIKKKKISKNI